MFFQKESASISSPLTHPTNPSPGRLVWTRAAQAGFAPRRSGRTVSDELDATWCCRQLPAADVGCVGRAPGLEERRAQPDLAAGAQGGRRQDGGCSDAGQQGREGTDGHTG